jgi:hypothetical protein
MVNEMHVITLNEDEALVLFEFLSHAAENAPSNGQANSAEQVVFNRVLASLESTLVQPFSPDYRELLSGAQARVVNQT